MITWIKRILGNDPVYSCDVYLDKKAGSCSHVDGFLCDFPKCTIREKYLDVKIEKILQSSEIML